MSENVTSFRRESFEAHRNGRPYQTYVKQSDTELSSAHLETILEANNLITVPCFAAFHVSNDKGLKEIKDGFCDNVTRYNFGGLFGAGGGFNLLLGSPHKEDYRQSAQAALEALTGDVPTIEADKKKSTLGRVTLTCFFLW